MAVRILLLAGWLLVPLAGYAWHQGPGQARLALDDAGRHAHAAEADAAAGRHESAVEGYDRALAALPPNRPADARRLRLAKAKSQMLARQLPEAHGDLKALTEELSADPAADPKLVADARSTLANSRYYMTWLMRLEGLGRDDWEPEIEAARQSFALLAQQSEAAGDAAGAARHKEDLESAVRLARMDLGELQGLNLPCQCKCKGSCKKPGKKVGKMKPEKNDIRGAGGAPPLDDSGH